MRRRNGDAPDGGPSGAFAVATRSRRDQYQPCDVEGVPRTARRAVAAGDVAEAPRDLRRRVGLPVGTGRGHLAAGQCLRDPVRAARVGRVDVPPRLVVPELDEAAELVVAPAAGERACRGRWPAPRTGSPVHRGASSTTDEDDSSAAAAAAAAASAAAFAAAAAAAACSAATRSASATAPRTLSACTSRRVDEGEDALGREELVVVEGGDGGGERAWRRPCPAPRRWCRRRTARVSSACFTARASRMPPWASSCCTSMFAASVSARVSATRSFCAATAPWTTKPVPTMAPMAATAPAAMRGPRRQPLGLRLARRETAWLRTGSMEFSGVEEGWFCMTFTGADRAARGHSILARRSSDAGAPGRSGQSDDPFCANPHMFL